jgi:serine protease Do
MPARSAMALAAALVVVVCGTAPAAADTVLPDEPAPSERVTATVNPALVRVTGTFAGWVRSRQGAAANSGWPFTVTVTCTGFGVNPDGYLATAGHCVDANDPWVRQTFIRAAAEKYAVDRPDVPLDKMMEWGWSAWTVEGQALGSPVESAIRVTGIAGSPSDGLLARVVDDRPVGQGDVGLLKVDTTDLPTLELASGAGIAVGTPLLAAGYPESTGERIEPGAAPSIEAGAVDETSTEQGRPVFRVDAAADMGMRGGPAVDDSGRVLGINTVRTSGPQLISVVIPISGFTDLLGRNGVRAEPGPRDLRYREAVDAYYGGEYTDAIDAIDRLEQDGPIHPRVGKLRSDAQTSRDLYGDASENLLEQVVVWVGIGTGALVIVALGASVVARRRRRNLDGIGPSPYPPFPGPPHAGPPWQSGPAGPLPTPAWQPVPPNPPHGPYQRSVAPRPPVAAPGPAPAAGGAGATEPQPSAPTDDRNDATKDDARSTSPTRR